MKNIKSLFKFYKLKHYVEIADNAFYIFNCIGEYCVFATSLVPRSSQ